jgi:uncharacterized repeat protein (TIGR01451 family)
MKGKYLATVTVLTSALVATAQAQKPDSARALLVTAENVTAVEARSSRPGDQLRPGDVVRYRLSFTNLRPDSVRSVQFNDRVPAGLRYVAGSASADRSDVVIEFSIDSGRTYSERPEIEQVINGQKVRAPAPPERYTHVRWSERGWVRARGKVIAEFKAQLPATTGVPANQ